MRYSTDTLRGDLAGGVAASAVALPVALAFGVASGLGPQAGLYGAIAVGFFASVFGSGRSQISAPTLPMAVAMAVVVASYASTLVEALVVVVMAGLLQVLLGISGIGRFVAYTPHLVLSGLMSGIGIIVMLMQTSPFLGLPASASDAMGSIRAWQGLADSFNGSAFAIAVATLAVGALWPRRWERRLPSPPAALVVGTLLGVFWLNDAPVVGAVSAILPQVQFQIPELAFFAHALVPAAMLALLGSLESLLISPVAHALTGTPHNANRELIGQGVGNMVAGLIGGVPGAGSSRMTMPALRVGARTPMASVVFAALLLALWLGFGRYVEQIPYAVFAGILMKFGWECVDWRLLRRIRLLQIEYSLVMLTTLTLTVFVDLFTGVAIGLIAAGMAHARQLEGLELANVLSVPVLDRKLLVDADAAAAADRYSARVGLVRLNGRFTVASAHKLTAVVGADIKDHEVVIFDFSGASSLDDSAAMVVDRLLQTAVQERTQFILMGMSPAIRNVLQTLGVLQQVPEGRVAGTFEAARQIANDILEQGDPR